MSRHWCTQTAVGVRIAVQITPNAKKTEIVGETEGMLRIKLHAPPVDGKANEALIRYIADAINVPKSCVSITHGFTGRKKLLEIRASNQSVDTVMHALSSDG